MADTYYTAGIANDPEGNSVTVHYQEPIGSVVIPLTAIKRIGKGMACHFVNSFTHGKNYSYAVLSRIKIDVI